MRKLFLTLGVSILTMISCTTNNEDLQNDSVSRIDKVLKERNESVQRLMYQMLTAEEKFSIWADKLDKALEYNVLNTEQRQLLIDVRKNLSVNLFENSFNNDKAEVFKNIYVKDFINKAKKHFEDEQIYNLFFSLNNNNTFVTDRRDTAEENCTCKKGSMFSCGIGTGVECGEIECKVKPDGCGFLFINECDGRCKL